MSKGHYFRVVGLVGLATALAACSMGDAAEPEGVDQDDEAPITVLTHPTIFGAIGGETFVDEFTEATGIQVEVATADIGPHLDRLLADFRAGNAAFDVVALQNVDYMPRVTTGLADLGPFIEDAAEDWDWQDFLETMRDFAAVDGVQYGVPVRLGTQMLYYRADLLEDAQLEPPTTFNEYVEVANALTTSDVYGAVQRGVPRDLANDWLGFFYSAGGVLLDDNNQCAVDSEAGIAATDLFVNLTENGSLPPDHLAWGRDDYISAMQQGNAAMGVYFSPYWGLMANPEESTVADELRFALSPVVDGVPEGTSRAQTWNFSISASSGNQSGAWEFIEMATSPENSLRSALEFSNGPVRDSTYESSEYLEAYPVATAWQEAAAAARTDPPIDELPQIIDILATHVTNAVSGSATSADAMSAACSEINAILP